MSDLSTKIDLLEVLGLGKPDKITLDESHFGLNSIWLCCYDEKKVIIKKYNQYWVDSSCSVLENINFGLRYSKACVMAGINSSVGLFENPVFLNNCYWQVFDYIEKDDYLYNYTGLDDLAKKMLAVKFDFLNHRSYEMLVLSGDQLIEFNRMDKLLLKWSSDNISENYNGVSHKDLATNNLIYSNNKINVIDFDFSGPRSAMVDALAVALDFGLRDPPPSLLKSYSLSKLREEALPTLIEEWRCWYNQLAYLSKFCVLAKNSWFKQQFLVKNQTINQLNSWFYN